MSVVLVVTPPRTGSSLVAGVLHRLGVVMGQDFLPADGANPRGYFEDRVFLHHHSRLTDTWEPGVDPPDGRWPKWPVTPPPEAVHRYRQLLADRDARHPRWGVKDPRLCFVFPIFQECYAGDDLRVVTVERPAAAIAASLLRIRNPALFKAPEGDPERQALLRELLPVATAYRQARNRALADCPGPVLWLPFPYLFRRPVRTVVQLAAFAGVEYNHAALQLISS